MKSQMNPRDKVEQILEGLRQAVLIGMNAGCDEYVINVNRGESQAIVKPDLYKAMRAAQDLYICLAKTKTRLVEEPLNVNPEHVYKIYFHAMQGGVGTVVIGVLADKELAGEDVIIEHVV